jgi:hypothetical protein
MLGSLEANNLSGRDFNDSLSGRIETFTSSSLLDDEGSESSNLDFFSLVESSGYFIEDFSDNRISLSLSQLALLSNSGGKFNDIHEISLLCSFNLPLIKNKVKKIGYFARLDKKINIKTLNKAPFEDEYAF